jgi:hypothetical protein
MAHTMSVRRTAVAPPIKKFYPADNHRFEPAVTLPHSWNECPKFSRARLSFSGRHLQRVSLSRKGRGLAGW